MGTEKIWVRVVVSRLKLLAPNPASSLRLRPCGLMERPALSNGTWVLLRAWLSTMYHFGMKALLLSQYNQLDIADLPAPEPGEGEILGRVAACGICGSDVHGYDGGSGRRIPPIVMGHEGAGVIERVGAEVEDYKPGERVTFDSTVYCGHCEFCQRG